MLDPGLLLAAKTDSLISSESLVKVGGAAGAFALLGLLLVLPLYLTQRREVARLLQWMSLEPHRGDDGAPLLLVGEEQAATGAPRRGITTGEMTPAERVTADRPALERITTDRPALAPPSFWERLIARGPRHPLVLSIAAVLVAVAIVAGVVIGIGSLEEQPGGDGSGFDRAGVEVVVLNGTSKKDFARKVRDSVEAAGFTQVRTGQTGSSRQTVVLFAPQQRRAATVLARELNAKVVQKIRPQQQAIVADADVVVIAGEDRARA